jgi:D-tyrosyl-tRNA(Tyr) deacylase
MLLLAGGHVPAWVPIVGRAQTSFVLRDDSKSLAQMVGSGDERQAVIGIAQRVTSASVLVAEGVVAQIGPGLLVLVGVAHTDTGDDARALGAKIAGLRVFGDDDGQMNKSVVEIGGQVLVVSQFTLLADVRRGRRPSFVEAAAPGVAAPLIEEVQLAIAALGVPVSSGVFGAHMTVELVNDGPVTLILRTESGRIV